jgi:AcrR family transcriptional regulator
MNRKEAKIEEICRAALGSFSSYGYRKTTLGDIASELGMTQSNLYFYVKDKKDLYEKAVGYALERWQQYVLEAIDREQDVRKRFLVMCGKAVEYLLENEELRRILVHDPDIFPMFPGGDPYEAINNRSFQMIRSMLEQGMAEDAFRRVDVDKTSQVIMMIYKMLVIHTYIRTDREFTQELFGQIMELMTQGLFKEMGDGPS